MTRAVAAVGAGRPWKCSLGYVFLPCFAAALLLVILSAASHHISVQPATQLQGPPESAPIADGGAGGAAGSGDLPQPQRQRQQQRHRSMREAAAQQHQQQQQQQQQQQTAMEAASAQQLAAQQAGAAIHPLSERITAAPVAAVGSLDGDPQNSLQRARLDSTGQSDRAEAGAAAAGALAQPSIVAAAGVRAGGGNGSSTAGSSTAGGGGAKPALFLFIGILSGRGYRHRRLAVREAWSRQAQMPNISAARFILSADEHNAHVQSEVGLAWPSFAGC